MFFLAVAASPLLAELMAASKEGRIVLSESSRRYRAAIADKKNADYVSHITAIEKKHGLPAGLLVRVAWQESRFNPKARNAGSGASGMFQIVELVHPEMRGKTLDWRLSADYAAGYLIRLFKRFKKWEHAVKAYNCGQGNMSQLLAGKTAGGTAGGGECNSKETREYWSGVSADVQGLV